MTDQAVPSDAESKFIDRLIAREAASQQVTLLVGSGLGDPKAPTAVDVMTLANRYAEGRNDEGDLRNALARVPDGPTRYDDYRRVLADWLAPDEFDAIAQQSVLLRYRPK